MFTEIQRCIAGMTIKFLGLFLVWLVGFFNRNTYAFSSKNSAVALKSEGICKPRASHRHSILLTRTMSFNCTPMWFIWIRIAHTPEQHYFCEHNGFLPPPLTKPQHFVCIHSEMDEAQLADNTQILIWFKAFKNNASASKVIACMFIYWRL